MAIEVGEKVDGKISGITNFGAFVDLGDHQTGLVHISEVSEGFVKDINDILSVGDEVKVKVLKIENKKISLSIRKAVDKPKEVAHSHSKDNHHSGNKSFGDHHQNRRSGSSFNNNAKHSSKPADFDDLMAGFLKESEDRLATLKRNTEGKRGGRGGRRS